MEKTSVSVDLSFLISQIEMLNKKNAELTEALRQEKEKKEFFEKEIDFLKTEVVKPQTKIEKPERKEGEYSEYKSNGKLKARKADSVRSYDDFKAVGDYFKARREYRNYAMWVVGCGTGLRFSDISKIQFKTFLNEDNTFRERFKIYEKKTSKLQNCLITPAIESALRMYLNSIRWNFNREDYVFGIGVRQGWKILHRAKVATDLPWNMGTHSMRKSFVTIAYCLGGYTKVDNRLEVLQGILNHSSSLITRRYIGLEQDMYDKARMVVSDFLQGKSEVNVLTVVEDNTIENIMEKLDKLEELITNAA